MYWKDYEEMGLKPIPLIAGTKEPIGVDGNGKWKEPIMDQWRGVESTATNIGIRLDGDGLAILDVDDEEAKQVIERALDQLGLLPMPTVKTGGSHDGYQYWIQLEAPEWFTLGNFSQGKGELRVRDCYVVVPDSVIIRPYVFERVPEEVLCQPEISWKDLGYLVGPSEAIKEARWSRPAIPILRSKLGDAEPQVWGLVKALNTASMGKPILGYRGTLYASRSEAMAAVVRIMLRKGWTWTGIRSFFWKHAPMYLGQKEGSIRYTARKFSAEMTPPELVAAYESGLGIESEATKAVYRAFLSEAARWCGKYPFEDNPPDVLWLETTYRDLARLVKISAPTAQYHAEKLEQLGLIECVTKGSYKKLRSVWRIQI